MDTQPRQPAKPLRADARRNRERVLAAAREIFEAEGVFAPLDEIARRAGVGAGTVYRHFPTKEALLEAIVVGNMEALIEEAALLCEAGDPEAAFFAFFERMVEQGAANRAFTGVLTRAGVDVRSVAGHRGRDLLDALATLLTRAQRAGKVREDLTAQQVKALLVGVLAGGDWLGGTQEDRRHLLKVVADGLRLRE
ncbi:helix-turn-helix domain-containing protein [Streptosporangium sp. NPDC051022]|uniref:TetR/AcrR family transcriptional regulator n=1 Tax=Streptosporangium sp. NPDC051022 TaxID=3155752 RepID=UPI00343AE1D8